MARWIVVFLLLGCTMTFGQSVFVPPRAGKQRIDPPAGNPLLDPTKSSVYMEFKKVGRCPEQKPRGKDDRVWLGLRNNTRWQVVIRANGVESKCYGEATPMYAVEADESRVPDGPIPHGHWLDVASLVEIDPGEALVFSVPKTNLDPGLSIRVEFEFIWEENNRYTRHSSYFSYWDLPDRLHDKEKEKKLRCVSGACVELIPAPPQPMIPMPPSLSPTPMPQPDIPHPKQ